MTRRVHPWVLGSAAIAALLGVWLPWPVALGAALLVGWGVAEVVVRLEARHLRRVAERVSSWLGDHPAPSVIGDAAGWRELGIAVNALGAAHDRRGDELRRERPWRRGLVDALVGPALLFSGDGRMLAANEQARALLGIRAGERAPTVVQALGSAALAGAVHEARESGRPVEVEAEVAGRELEAVASVVGDETLVVVTDRSRERRLTALRRDFVTNASHELKTPATSIQALADALDVVLASDPSRARELAARLQTESGRLVRLVHDLLDLRRLEVPGPDEHAPVDLVELLRQVVAEHADRAADQDVRISLQLPDSAVVVGIAQDLRLVATNLVANALQYNRPGGEVHVEVTPLHGAHRLTVADTGIGIAQQDQARIFERFYRVDAGRSRDAGGTGLGLSLVRHAVERHGGQITVDSLLGEGSTFAVDLPVEPTGPR